MSKRNIRNYELSINLDQIGTVGYEFQTPWDSEQLVTHPFTCTPVETYSLVLAAELWFFWRGDFTYMVQKIFENTELCSVCAAYTYVPP